MTNTFVDGLYSIIPGVFGFPRRTLIVEGNRELTPVAHTTLNHEYGLVKPSFISGER